MSKKYIHINQSVIRKNRKTGSRDPVISCKTYKSNDYGHSVIIYDSQGREVARVVYRPDKPLSCGATVWLEVHDKHASVKVVDEATTAISGQQKGEEFQKTSYRDVV